MNKVQNYIKTIKKKYPNIIVDNVKKNNIGQNNDVIIINDEYVFRFPKYKDAINSFENEVKVIYCFKEKLNISIPNPIYVCFDNYEVGEVFAGYKIIEGQPLFKDEFLKIKDKQTIADQLGNFLNQLHNTPEEMVEDVSLEVCNCYDKWENFYKKISSKLFEYMNEKAKIEIEKNFEDFLNKEENFNFEKTLVHGDFGPSNILFSSKTNLVSGIIDFGSIRFDDPAIDIAAMIGPFGYGESFVKMLQRSYPDVHSLINRAKFYTSTFALQEALFGFENEDQEAFNDGMANYI